MYLPCCFKLALNFGKLKGFKWDEADRFRAIVNEAFTYLLAFVVEIRLKPMIFESTDLLPRFGQQIHTLSPSRDHSASL